MSSIRFQQKLQQQRVRDDRRDELVASVTHDKTLRENFKSDDRAGTQRVIREQREAMKEQYTAAQMQAAHEAQQRTQRLRMQDEKLAAELVKRKTESIREQKNIQRVVEQSEELRDLEEKLKQAYMNKERDAQVLESAALLKKERAADADIAGLVEVERQRGLQAEAYRDYLRQKEGRTIKVALNAQVEEKMEMKRQAQEQFVKEKADVDAVVAAIEEEDRREAEAREIKESQIRAHITDFVREKEIFKHQHAVRAEAEKAEIRAYADEVMQRETAFRLAREQDQHSKDEIFARLASDMAERQLVADEMETLRNELSIQETEERVIQKEREKAERAEQNKKDIGLANEYQRQLKAIQREEEKGEEEAFKAAMMAKFAEDDRLDQMNEQRRRMKRLEHRREIERLLERRRAKFEEERQAQVGEQRQQDAADATRGKIIEAERRRLLAAHAKNLDLKHLPKGVLQGKDDLHIFNKESIFAGHSGHSGGL